MFKRIIIAISVVLTLLLSGLPASAALASSLPVVYGVPYGHQGGNFVDGKIKPTGELLWTGDGSAWFIIHSWKSWTASAAWGSATVHVRSCWGSCIKYKTEHTTLHFYRVEIHNGRPYFTRLHFGLSHKVAGLGSGTLMFFNRGNPAWYTARAFDIASG